MTSEGYQNAVTRGEGIKSSQLYSVPGEGTSFSDKASDAESYVNFGRDDPRTTGRPTYIIEVRGQDGLNYDKRDGYYKAPAAIPNDRIARVFEMRAERGRVVAHVISGQAREAAAPEQTEKFDVRRGERNKIVIAAPHGASDKPTAAVAAELARRLRVSSVVARVDGDGPRINVNRPTEGVGDQGEDPSAERRTPRAERTYRRWLAAVSYAADGGPDLYVEIHDNDFPGTQDALEVATVGVTPAQARMLRHKWEALDTSVAMRVEPVDRLEWNGVVAKRIGIFAKTPRALQVELPLKFSRQAGAGEHGAIEALKDWLDGAIGVLA